MSSAEPKSSTKQLQKSNNNKTFLPAQLLLDFIRSPIFAGAVATSLSALPAIPYNNILVSCSATSTNPSSKECLQAAKRIIAQEGFWNFGKKKTGSAGGGLMRHISPIICGQICYGAALFYFFETFRARFLHDESNKEVGRKRNTLSEIALSAFGAEFWAAFFLAPFEVAYLRMISGRSGGEFPQTLPAAFKELASHPSRYGFPFAPLRTLWSSGMPRTAATFVMFEIFSVLFSSSYVQKAQVEQVSRMMMMSNNSSSSSSTNGGNNGLHEPSRSSQLQVSFSAGFFAGLFFEFIHHPFDRFSLFRQQVWQQQHQQFPSGEKIVSRVQPPTSSPGQEAVEQMRLKNIPFPHDQWTEKPTSSQIFAQWVKTQTDPRILWRGFGPKAWMGSVGCGLMWFLFDAISGKNRIMMPHHKQ